MLLSQHTCCLLFNVDVVNYMIPNPNPILQSSHFVMKTEKQSNSFRKQVRNDKNNNNNHISNRVGDKPHIFGNVLSTSW